MATVVMEKKASVKKRPALKKVKTSIAKTISVRKPATYADCLSWDPGFRAQIINGEIIEMPSPTTEHAKISLRLVLKIGAFLEQDPIGQLYAAPVDVRLFPRLNNEDSNVLVPDIMVVCDPEKDDARSINGAPDFVVEILSPSTAKYDEVDKYKLYQKAGVREYWIIDPEKTIVKTFILENGKFIASVYDENDTVKVSVLPGCEIDLKSVFAAAVPAKPPKKNGKNGKK